MSDHAGSDRASTDHAATDRAGRHLLDSNRSSFTIRFRPAMGGLAATVTGLRGAFDASFRDDGTVDWDAPLGGWFALHVGEVRTGNHLVTLAMRRFLELTRNDEVRGEVAGAVADGPSGFRGTATIHLNGRSVPVAASGRVTRASADGENVLHVVGSAQADPAAFGVPLPPMVNFAVLTRWRLVLRPG